MCVAYPGRVVCVEDGLNVRVDVGGRQTRVSWIVLGDRVPHPGEWLLIQAGLAVAVIDEQEAAERLRLLDEAWEA